MQFGAWSLRWCLSPAAGIQRRGNVTWFPPGALVVRPWQPGDRMVPFGGTGSRKLRRVLMEGHVPADERESYPVVERDGEVVWVPGLCRAATAIPDAGQTALELEVAEGTPLPSADTTTRVDG
jgi:tRNA(Ile)-lysidine synthetase-like protein